MKEILAKHPDLDSILTIHEPKIYKVLDENDDIVEYWERNDEGHYVDVTEREKAKIRLVRAQEEYERLKKLIEKEKTNG